MDGYWERIEDAQAHLQGGWFSSVASVVKDGAYVP